MTVSVTISVSVTTSGSYSSSISPWSGISGSSVSSVVSPSPVSVSPPVSVPSVYSSVPSLGFKANERSLIVKLYKGNVDEVEGTEPVKVMKMMLFSAVNWKR